MIDAGKHYDSVSGGSPQYQAFGSERRTDEQGRTVEATSGAPADPPRSPTGSAEQALAMKVAELEARPLRPGKDSRTRDDRRALHHARAQLAAARAKASAEHVTRELAALDAAIRNPL